MASSGIATPTCRRLRAFSELHFVKGVTRRCRCDHDVVLPHTSESLMMRPSGVICCSGPLAPAAIDGIRTSLVTMNHAPLGVEGLQPAPSICLGQDSGVSMRRLSSGTSNHDRATILLGLGSRHRITSALSVPSMDSLMPLMALICSLLPSD